MRARLTPPVTCTRKKKGRLYWPRSRLGYSTQSSTAPPPSSCISTPAQPAEIACANAKNRREPTPTRAIQSWTGEGGGEVHSYFGAAVLGRAEIAKFRQAPDAWNPRAWFQPLKGDELVRSLNCLDPAIDAIARRALHFSGPIGRRFFCIYIQIFCFPPAGHTHPRRRKHTHTHRNLNLPVFPQRRFAHLPCGPK